MIIEHRQHLTATQNKFIVNVQLTMQEKHKAKFNKSQALAKVIDYLVVKGIDVNEIVNAPK